MCEGEFDQLPQLPLDTARPILSNRTIAMDMVRQIMETTGIDVILDIVSLKNINKIEA